MARETGGGSSPSASCSTRSGSPSASALLEGWGVPIPQVSHAMRELLKIAVHAAEAGGAVIRESFGGTAVGEAKAAGDYVSETDRRSEDTIRALLEELTPDLLVLGEESGGSLTVALVGRRSARRHDELPPPVPAGAVPVALVE